MNHRIFIAVNLPQDIKKSLNRIQEKNASLPAKWVNENNLHITLAFLGNMRDEDIMGICKKVSEVAMKTNSFSLRLNKVLYGPPKKLPPRMLWVKGEKSKELGELQKNLEESLTEIKTGEENRDFSPHITLARIQTWQWKGINPEERPQVEEDINLEFEVESIEVMESYLKGGSPRYEVLESYQLSEE